MSPRHLPIAPESWPFLVPSLAAAALLAPTKPRLGALALTTAATIAFFFRDPARPLAHRPERLYAPADGWVLRVEPADIPELGGPAWRVAIFLSLLDVHINRSPTAGLVASVEHRPGKLQSAWDPGVERVNERNTITMLTDRGPLQVVQIAGLVARRIVCYARPGLTLGSGERFGLIKFSSRTDLLFPQSMATPLVAPGKRVHGGLSVLAACLE